MTNATYETTDVRKKTSATEEQTYEKDERNRGIALECQWKSTEFRGMWLGSKPVLCAPKPRPKCWCNSKLKRMFVSYIRILHLTRETVKHMWPQILWWNNAMALKSITKTRLYSFDPLKPHFYIVKLGFTGVYINFLISAQKHRFWVLVRTASTRRF